jgi:protein TonB
MSYVSQKQRANPVGLTAAIAINGAVVLAALMSSMVIAPRIIKKDPTVINVPVKSPPPPDKKIEPRTELPKPKPQFLDKPIIDIPVKPLNGTMMTNEATDTTLWTDPAGTTLAANTDVKTVIERVLPLPVFKAATRDPKFVRNFQPDYPVGLLQREIEGRATIKVLIGTDGRVRQANVLSATHTDFGKAAMRQALTEWRFMPATRDGRPIEEWQTLTVRFDINE